MLTLGEVWKAAVMFNGILIIAGFSLILVGIITEPILYKIGIMIGLFGILLEIFMEFVLAEWLDGMVS